MGCWTFFIGFLVVYISFLEYSYSCLFLIKIRLDLFLSGSYLEILYKLIHSGCSCPYQLVVRIWIKFWIFYSVSLACMLVLVTMICCFDYCSFSGMEYQDAFLVRKLSASVSHFLRLAVLLIVFLTKKVTVMYYLTQFYMATGEPNTGPCCLHHKIFID